MAKITGNEISPGTMLNYDGGLWIAVKTAKVKPGKVLFEMEGVSETDAREAFRLAGAKLSVSTTFVKRQVR